MAKKKQKKLESYPYFLINSLGSIQHYAEGGELPLMREGYKYGTGGNLPGQEVVNTNNIGSIIDASKSTVDVASSASSAASGGMNMANAGSAINAGGAVLGMAGDAIGGDTHISQDRSAGVEKATGTGVLKGAGQGASLGASIGSVFPGAGTVIGGAIGAVAGGIYGGIKGNSDKKKEVTEYGQYMEEQRNQMGPLTTSYTAAYGMELPQMALGGPTDPPTGGTKTPNPNYNTQLAEYNLMKGMGQDPKMTATMDDAMRQRFQANRDVNYPEFKGLNLTSATYDPNSLDAKTGLPNTYRPHYEMPSREFTSPTGIASGASSATGVSNPNPNMLDANTGMALPNMPTMPGQQVDYQFGQHLDMGMNSSDATASRADRDMQITDRKTEIANMSDEERRLASGKLTASERNLQERQAFMAANKMAMGGEVGQEMKLGGDATEYNGNRHEAGGINIGKAEVEDGEVRVGNYVFSDRLSGDDGRTFASAAKKITKKFEEYENDGPSMRTQNKMLEELSFQNDQARLLQQKKDAETEMMMQEDYAAYGGMVNKDGQGNFIVDKNNRMELIDGAKARKMSYGSYIESLHAYGGKLQEKLALGGGVDPADEWHPPMVSENYDYPGLNMETPSAPTGYFGDDFGAGAITRDVNGDVSQLSARRPSYTSDARGLDLAGTELPTFDNAGLDKSTSGTVGDGDSYLDRLKAGYGNEERALLASQLPSMANLAATLGGTDTSFDRVKLDKVNLDQERRSVSDAVDRARRVQRENVRGTATSSGDALAALSAGNAGLTQAEMDNMARINERETNANIQTSNQEKMTNTSISHQEMEARQRDKAMKDSVRSLALSGMAENYQGYSKDKALNKENEAANKRLLSLLDTGEYNVEDDGEGGYKISYKTKTKDTKTKTKD